MIYLCYYEKTSYTQIKPKTQAQAWFQEAYEHSQRQKSVEKPQAKRKKKPDRMKQGPPARSRAVDDGAVKRLTQSGDYKHVYATGVKHDGRLLKVYIALNSLGQTRLGVVVGKNVSPSAVVRNRIKRILRHAAVSCMRASTPCEALDIVVVVRAGRCKSRESISLREDLSSLLKRWPC